MPGRKYTASSSSYRYGFNGKENDNEVKGQGNLIDYGMRGYDPRLGRFLSVDPFFKSYPFYSSYQYAGNNPVKYVDLDGGEPESPRDELKNIRLTNSIDKGNVIRGNYDPKDPLHLIYVEKVFDPIKKQAFFIHQENETSYYWNSTEDNIRIRRVSYLTESNGQWEKYETYEQKQVKVRGGAADVILGFLGAGAAVTVVVPLAVTATPTLIAAAPNLVAGSWAERGAAAASDALIQYASNAEKYGFGSRNLSHINIASVITNAVMPNQDIIAGFLATGLETNMADRYKGVLSPGANNGNLLMNSVFNAAGNKLSSTLDDKIMKYITKGKATPFVSQMATENVGNAAATVAQTITEAATEKKE